MHFWQLPGLIFIASHKETQDVLTYIMKVALSVHYGPQSNLILFNL